MSNVEFNHMFMPTVYRCLTKDRCVEVCGELDRERVSSNPDGIPFVFTYADNVYISLVFTQLPLLERANKNGGSADFVSSSHTPIVII